MEIEAILKSKGMWTMKTAFVHTAKVNVGGKKTLLKLLNAYKHGTIRDAHKLWIFIDEGSQVPLGIWAALARFKMLGVRFVVAGDWFQQLPIHEPYGQEAAIRMETGSLLHELCGGLRYNFEESRRSDVAHFNYYCGLRWLPDSRLAADSWRT